MIYPQAPIREAIFDIRVKPLANKTYDDMADLKELVKHKYEKERKVNMFEGSFSLGEEAKSETNSFFRGVIYSNADNTRQVQFRIDGFTLNYLNPYSNWEEFKAEAYELWLIYLNKFPNVEVDRLGLRYINKIEIPLTFRGFEDYVTNIPPIPSVLPKKLQGFFSQISVPCEDDEYSAIISATMETPNSKNLPYILDIDITKEVKSNFEFENFDYMRSVKNSIFEDSITDKCRQLFK